MLSRYSLFLFLLTQLIWAVPTCSRVTLRHRSLFNRLSIKSDARSGSKPSVAAAWYAGWHSADFTLQDLSWSKYTHVFYAFATTNPHVNLVDLTDADEELLPQFVQAAHSNNVKAIISLGGWGGSQHFSTLFESSATQKYFAHVLMKFVSKHGLDGIEFAWEYPNKQGIGCNTISANDSANFLAFLQKFRNQAGAKDFFVSAAVPIQPFVGPDGNPLTNVTGFAEVLDYIEIMNYDDWGSWSSAVGPNSALDDSCAPPAERQGSAISAVNAWSKAGFPLSRMILGIPTYGHSFRVSKSSALDSSGNIQLYAPFNKSDQPPGDSWDITAGSVDACGNPTVTGGIFNFWGLIEAGFLKNDGTVANGIEYDFDDCSKTPYIYNATSEVMVSFDDATSFAAKGQYIEETGLAGFILWQAGGDHNDILLDAIKSAVDGS